MSGLSKKNKTIICIGLMVIIVICALLIKNVLVDTKGTYKSGNLGVVEQSGYKADGVKYVFNTQQECYIKTDNYDGLEEIDLNFSEIADKDVVVTLKFWDKDGNKLTDYVNAMWKKGTNYCRIPVDNSDNYSAYKIMIPHDFTLKGINFSKEAGGALK